MPSYAWGEAFCVPTSVKSVHFQFLWVFHVFCNHVKNVMVGFMFSSKGGGVT